ncbi:MAG: protein NrnU [Betaproteobacteria bacterium RIFCSPLOWO2_02_FULL_62_17]|nr:MAG: protein NrnU [Betaproteobacteria bacterium RIFCSPLOWO2_02_FULL_62_17]
MTLLILGLLVFLGVHSVRIFAADWRARQIVNLGAGPWKGLYTLASLVGFAMIVWGYGMARAQPVEIWSPPVWTRPVAGLLTIVAFILITAAYVPRNAIKSKLHHPMILGVKVWALAHLLANGTLAGGLLFGAFLAWAVLDFRAARLRDRSAGTIYAAGTVGGTVVAIAASLVVWAVFAYWLHPRWIGVSPFGAQ